MWLDSDFNWIWERFEHGQKVFSVMKILKICGMILEWNILLIDTELLLKLWRIGLWKENALHKLLSCKTWSMLLYVDWSEWIRNREFGRYHDYILSETTRKRMLNSYLWSRKTVRLLKLYFAHTLSQSSDLISYSNTDGLIMNNPWRYIVRFILQL